MSKYRYHFLSSRYFLSNLTAYFLWYFTDLDMFQCEELGLMGHETVLGEWFPDILEDCCTVIFCSQDVPEILNTEELCSLQMPGTTHPVTQHHIPEDLNPEKHCYENLKFCSF